MEGLDLCYGVGPSRCGETVQSYRCEDCYLLLAPYCLLLAACLTVNSSSQQYIQTSGSKPSDASRRRSARLPYLPRRS